MASLPEDMKVVLVGHRGVGKRDLARRIAGRLQVELLDVERQMEESSIEQAVVDANGREVTRDYASPDERGYQLRQGVLTEGLRRDGRRIIAVPPGCCVTSAESAEGAACPWMVWVRASGWRYDARKREGEPPRHPSWKAEFEWRIQTRRPRWESRADFEYNVPYGRTPERSAELLEARLRVLGDAARSAGSVRAWSVPAGPSELRRSIRDAEHLGGGVKIRQREFPEPPNFEQITEEPPRKMVSLGEGLISWVVQPGVTAIEVEVGRAAELAESGLLDELPNLRRVWVTLRSAGASENVQETLGQGAAELDDRLSGTDIEVAPRWRPRIGAWAQLKDVLETMRAIRQAWPSAEVTPVGARWVGVTPWFATRNPSFELSTGLAQWRRTLTETGEEPAVDLQALVPTLAGEPPEGFDAIIGAGVIKDRAAEWHRMAALTSDEPYGAIACESLPDPDDASLRAMFDVIQSLGVRGVAVDSPLRRRVLDVDGVRNPEALPAVNVLTRRGDGWESRDTDHVGMAAVLTEAARRGVEAGPIAMIGVDDRAPAIRRAISAALDWRLVHHADASGWGWDAPSHVALVVNLAGTAEGVYERPPSCELWVDLHDEVGSPPPVAEDHMCGDNYFEAQALAARDLWRRRYG